MTNCIIWIREQMKTNWNCERNEPCHVDHSLTLIRSGTACVPLSCCTWHKRMDLAQVTRSHVVILQHDWKCQIHGSHILEEAANELSQSNDHETVRGNIRMQGKPSVSASVVLCFCRPALSEDHKITVVCWSLLAIVYNQYPFSGLTEQDDKS